MLKVRGTATPAVDVVRGAGRRREWKGHNRGQQTVPRHQQLFLNPSQLVLLLHYKVLKFFMLSLKLILDLVLGRCQYDSTGCRRYARMDGKGCRGRRGYRRKHSRSSIRRKGRNRLNWNRSQTLLGLHESGRADYLRHRGGSDDGRRHWRSQLMLRGSQHLLV